MSLQGAKFSAVAVVGLVGLVYPFAASAEAYPKRQDCWRPKQDAPAFMYRRDRVYFCQSRHAQSEAESRYWLLRGAQKGHSTLMYFIYLGYRSGRYGLPKNEKLAALWLRRAAKAGLPQAQRALSFKLLSGSRYHPRHVRRARLLMGLLAEQNPYDKLSFSLYLRLGIGGPRVPTAADQLLVEAVAALVARRRERGAGDLSAGELFYRIAYHSACFTGGPVDVATARGLLLRAAKRQHREAQRLLALNLADPKVRKSACTDTWRRKFWDL